MAKYFDEIVKGTNLLAQQPNSIFLGQSVAYQGHVLSKVIKDIPNEKKIELPVFEETQMGMSIGMSLAGYLPISIYPRFNFLLLAANQIINHLDKISIISHGEFEPKVIIITTVGSERPLHPGEQHIGNFSEGFKLLLKHIVLEELTEPEQIYPAFEDALNRKQSTILVFHGDYFGEK
jgi:pyruvate/2-oxoglutarate/acetoin dehydrogenase E1 component